MDQASLDPNFKEFFECLHSEKVRYMLIGGYAVNYYGYHRSTDDLDIWIALGQENAERVSAVLQTFAGYPAEAVPPSLFLRPNNVIIFGREPLRIDVLTGPSGVDFEECFSRRREAVLDGVTLTIISLADLKRNKLASGRSKDLADLDNLPPT